MEALAHMCRINFPSDIHFGEKFTDDSIYDVIEDIAPTIDDIINKCEWQDERVPCDQIFSPVWTAAGICYGFNTLNSRNIFTEK